MRNFKVSAKLITSFVIVIALTLLVGGVGIYGMYRINDGGNRLYVTQARPLENLAEAREIFQRVRVQMRNIIVYTGDMDELAKIESDIKGYETAFTARMTEYERSIETTEARAHHQAIMSSFRECIEGINSMLRQAREDTDGSKGIELFEYMRNRLTVPADNVAERATTLMELRLDAMTTTNTANGKMFTMMLFVIIAVILLAVVLALALAVSIAGMISKPLAVLTAFMQRAATTGDIEEGPDEVRAMELYGRYKDEPGVCLQATGEFVNSINKQMDILGLIADGDLTVRPGLLSAKDKIGNSLSKTVMGLHDIFGEINESTHQVSDGSRQVAEGAQSLAQGSTEQAASVEELSATISEIEKKTRENADMAVKAASLANNIKRSAVKGSSQMDEMVSAVNEINQASQNISRVIKVIDDIAFQTNILALNAAVEAARAGQHGKGFAVVAEEVRNLAAKSAEAAKDTGGLISSSIEKAELGAKIAKETAESLSEIVSGINESTQLVTVISESSAEQSEAISQINMSLDQVSSVIQQTSATAEESAAASEEMSGQSDTLRELVARFKL
jgi:methyl-accepting chemotaxis protein